MIRNMGSVSKRMDTLSLTLDSLVQKINRAEGTVNYLITDTTLVRRIEHTMENIEEGTARFNENMEALKHNFLTRRYFRKLEKEEAKKANEEE